MKILENVRIVFAEPSFSFFTEYIKGILISPKKAVSSFYLPGEEKGNGGSLSV